MCEDLQNQIIAIVKRTKDTTKLWVVLDFLKALA